MDFKIECAKIISAAAEIDEAEVLSIIEIPPNAEMGDYAFPCFRLAKKFRKAPPIIAEELAKKINDGSSITKPESISEVRNTAGYLNFFTNKKVFAKSVINEVFEKGNNYGTSEIGKGKNIVIDYSSPNIAKPFHVGHLRSTVIGNSLLKIYEKLGYKCYGINHLGDWGTQFGKLIVAYKNWGSKDEVEKNGISELMRIYVLFHEKAEQNDELNDEARAWFVKMQNGDDEAISLWKWFYDISIKEFEKVYKMLGVNFHAYTGESFYNDKMDAIVDELKQKQLLKESEGAMIVDLGDMPPCLIIRKDGGTLYATRDITAAIYRKKTYDFSKSIYITALDQNLHFQQWFKVIEKMGYDWYKDLVHVPFGLVSLDTGKLSTRSGNVVLMEELLNTAISKTAQIINEKNPDLPNKDEVSKQVGIGAVIFNDLYNNRIKDVVFSWDKMLNFDGETGPYVQYTHARASSVLKKAEFTPDIKNIDYSLITDEASIEICKLIEAYPQKIIDAAEKYEPSILTRHIVAIAQAFNKFYHDNPILTSEENLKNARLAIVYAVKNILSSSLELLGISSPEQM